MPDLRSTSEDPIQLHDRLDFVNKQDIAPGENNKPAYWVEGKRNYLIGIERNTPVAPELYDTNGDRLDESARIVFQKTDPQQNPLGNAIILESNLDAWNYTKMRSDPEYFKTTRKSLLLDEREYLHIYIDIPSGSADFDASASRLTIGDNVTTTGKPVFVRDKGSLNTTQQEAANQASTSGGGN
jgi:hypothetical protein